VLGSAWLIAAVVYWWYRGQEWTTVAGAPENYPIAVLDILVLLVAGGTGLILYIKEMR